MKRIPDPEIDMMPSVMESISNGFYKKYKIFWATDEDKTVGWGVLYWPPKEKNSKFMVWTSKRHRGRGVASAIMRRACRFSKKITVFVHDDNSSNFYKKMIRNFKSTKIIELIY